MENQPIILERALKISIIAGVLAAALSVAYYFVIYLAQTGKMAQQLAQQQQQLQRDQIKLAQDKKTYDEALSQGMQDFVIASDCISKSEVHLNSSWADKCTSLGKEVWCSLQIPDIDVLNQQLHQDYANCFQKINQALSKDRI